MFAAPGMGLVADSRKSAICDSIACPHQSLRSRRQAIVRPPTRSDPSAPAARKPTARRKPPKPAEAAPKAPGTPRKKAAIAGPKGARTRKPAERSIDRLALMQETIVTSLADDKAEEIVTIDLTDRASFADRMVIATGLADRQIAAMATHLIEKLATIGVKRVQVEGASGSEWVLVDAGDIVVHLFKPEARTLYALEKMWGADLDEPA